MMRRFLASMLYRLILKNRGYSIAGTKNETTREEWTRATLKKIPPGTRILDAGAGELKFKEFCDHLDYVSQDFNEYDGAGDDKAMQTGVWDTSKIDIVSDITSIPVDDQSFGAVMCTEVLEHVPDPVSALKELDRLLVPGGYILITAPFCSLTHFSPYHFATGFNRYFYEHWMLTLGYDVIELKENGNFFEYLAQENRRLKSLGEKYTDTQLDPLDHAAIDLLLKKIELLSRLDKNSKELLCFGYFLFAKKKLQ